MKLGIIVAMQKEYSMLLRSLTVVNENEECAQCVTKNGTDIFLVKSGIGKVNAAMSAYNLIEQYGVTHIISTGCAGGANVSVEVSDVIVGNSYCYHDVWCGEPNANGQVQGMPAVFPSCFGEFTFPNEPNVKVGTIASGDWFVTTGEKMMRIINYLPSCYNVMAVDMESAAIAQVCYKLGVKFMAVRVISDNPLLPNQPKQYDGFWNDLAMLSFDFISAILNKI